MIHGDLKPDNILLLHGEEGSVPSVKAVDFGLCIGIGETVPEVTGCPGFMAPELAVADHEEIAAQPEMDTYAVGMIAVDMVCPNKLIKAGVLKQIDPTFNCKPEDESKDVEVSWERDITFESVEDEAEDADEWEGEDSDQDTRRYGPQVKKVLDLCEGRCELAWQKLIRMCAHKDPQQRATLQKVLHFIDEWFTTSGQPSASSESAHACGAMLRTLVRTAPHRHVVSAIDANELLPTSAIFLSVACGL